MKRILKTLTTVLLLLGKSYGATYLLPPDIDDLRQSTKSTDIRTISHSTRDTTHTFTIYLNGSYQSVRFDCIREQRINCKMGTWTVYASAVNFSAYEKDTSTSGTYNTTPITGIDIRYINDDATHFLICGMMATPNGNALLTDHDTPDAVGNPGRTYDSGNPSFLNVEILQVCK